MSRPPEYRFGAQTLHRLQYYREKADRYSDPKYRHMWGFALSWLYHRTPLCTWGQNHYGKDGVLYTDTLDHFSVTSWAAHECAKLDHTGWYTDAFQGNLIVGHVVKLRCPKGVLYIPATREDDGDVAFYLRDAVLVEKGGSDSYANEGEHEDARREVAKTADHYAEKEAEQMREEDVKYQAEQRIETLRDEIHDINKQALALLRSRKDNGFDEAQRDGLARELSAFLDERTERFIEIEKLEREPWSITE